MMHNRITIQDQLKYNPHIKFIMGRRDTTHSNIITQKQFKDNQQKNLKAPQLDLWCNGQPKWISWIRLPLEDFNQPKDIGSIVVLQQLYLLQQNKKVSISVQYLMLSKISLIVQDIPSI